MLSIWSENLCLLSSMFSPFTVNVILIFYLSTLFFLLFHLSLGVIQAFFSSLFHWLVFKLWLFMIALIIKTHILSHSVWNQYYITPLQQRNRVYFSLRPLLPLYSCCCIFHSYIYFKCHNTLVIIFALNSQLVFRNLENKGKTVCATYNFQSCSSL